MTRIISALIVAAFLASIPAANWMLGNVGTQFDPDRNAGDRTAWDQVEQAARVLGVAG